MRSRAEERKEKKRKSADAALFFAVFSPFWVFGEE